MRSKRATEPRELSAIVNREILPGLAISVSFAALSPFVLGYALYRLLMGRGAAFVPQDAFFLVGVVTSFALAWGLSSCIVAFLKVRHLAVRPLERLASAAAFRMNRGTVDPFRLKTRVGELVSLVAIFNRLFGSQDERVAELVALVHAFGHDANRYANHVSGAAYLCLDPVVPPERQKAHLAELPHVAVREIAAFQDHLVQTVGIVDNYNRIKGSPFAAVDVVSVAKGCLARLRPEADAKRLVLFAALPFSCVVRAHEQKLASVIDNLVGNAIKFTPEGGRIALSVGGQKVALVIAVTDTGCGIAADCRERVFDPGFRGTTAVEGHGLGLSFVRSVARFYGGTATCSSVPGQGSTFTVTLPLKAKGGLK